MKTGAMLAAITSALLAVTQGAPFIYVLPAQSPAAAAAYNTALAKLEDVKNANHMNHDKHSPALGGPTQTRITICDRSDFQGYCDYPFITDGVCTWVSIGAIINGPPQPGGPSAMSSFLIDDTIKYCELHTDLNCNSVAGFTTYTQVPEFIELLAPFDKEILSYKCMFA